MISTVEGIERMTRLCMECNKPSPELSISQRVCYKCHKSASEARARPYTETNVQKRARINNEICSHFDIEYLDRMRSAKIIDDENRRIRQQEILERKNKEMAEIRKKKLANKPFYSLDTVNNFHELIIAAFEKYGCLGSGMEGEALRQAAKVISKKTKIGYKILCTTLVTHATEYMSVSDVHNLATRIAGNYITLRKNIPLIDLAKGAPVEGWALMRVVGVNEKYTDRKGIPGFNMFTEILTGELAGTTIKAGYGINVCRRFGKKLGIKQEELKYITPKFLTNLHGWAYIAEGSGENRPRELDSNPAHKEYNRELTEYRMNITKCPKRYKPDTYSSCIECPLGYTGTAFKVCRYAIRRDGLTESKGA
jgi:hypothetical protein